MSNIPSSLLEQDKMIIKKSLHLRNDSDELDVFEAAKYFSGANELVLGANLSQKSMKEQHIIPTRLQNGGGRMSLDMPSMRNSIPSHAMCEKTEMPIIMKEKIKYKQPSSPGGKLASFLNSLFNQTSSKKKKSKSTTQSMKDEDESPGGGRRKRRSSISHFRSGSSNNIISSNSDSKSIYSTASSTTSGFRTPPPFGYIATKSTYKDQKPAALTGLTSGLTNGLTKPIVVLDEKFKFRDEFLEKNKNLGNGFLEKGRILAEKCQNEERESTFKRFDEDEGGDSDSSSDLFELTNCDLGYYSSGLPVYETTHMDSIKRGVPISSGGPILI